MYVEEPEEERVDHKRVDRIDSELILQRMKLASSQSTGLELGSI